MVNVAQMVRACTDDVGCLRVHVQMAIKVHTKIAYSSGSSNSVVANANDIDSV